jgi:hypothetical protein
VTTLPALALRCRVERVADPLLVMVKDVSGS